MSKKPIIVILLVWVIGCVIHAWYYVHTILSRPDLDPGYEQDSSFQLTMFLIFRFPVWFFGLFLILGAIVWRRAFRG